MSKSPRLVAAAVLAVGAGCLALVPAAPPAAAASGTFANPAPVLVPAGAPGTTVGNAAPYPSAITVTGLTGLVTDVDVTLDHLGHARPDDLDVLLVAPSGASVVLMSDACGATAVEDATWTFDDDAPTAMPDASPPDGCAGSDYRPSAYDAASDTWPAAYPSPHGATLSSLEGTNPLGTWQLYVRDDAGSAIGDLEAGWGLSITTGPADVAVPGTGTTGVAAPYPRAIPVADTGVVTDVDVVLGGVTHQHPDDLDVLLVSPTGQKVVLMSDVCGSFDVADRTWRFDDEAPAPMPDTGSTDVCPAGSYRPTNVGSETMTAPAPPGPYAGAMSAFDQQYANGAWLLYVQDDGNGDAGFLVDPPALAVTTRPRAETWFSTATATATEGSPATLTITRSAATALLPATVIVASAEGTAGPGDFTPFTTAVAFAAGQTQQVLQLATTADAVLEPAESFTVSLSAPTGDASIAAPSTATVTIVPPTPVNTTLKKRPPKRTTSRKATIAFAATVAGSTFECKVDQGPWRSCTSPLRLKKLSVGKHTVTVRASAGGGADPSPLTVTWRVRGPRG